MNYFFYFRPVQAMYPWEKPQNDKFRKAYDIDPLWNIFKPVILKTNHRQGEDRKYADMLNRFRVGECLKDDIEMMKKRIFDINDPRIPEPRMYIFGWNSEVNEMNAACLDAIEGEVTLNNFQAVVVPGTGGAGAGAGAGTGAGFMIF